MKKLFGSFALACAVIVGLAGCGGGGAKTQAPAKVEKTDSKEAVTIKIGHVEPEDRSTHKVLLDFKKNIEEKSKGSLKIELYPNGSMGGDVQLTESVAMGTLDSALPMTSVLTTYADDFGVLDMPYLFDKPENAFKALDGEVGQYFNEKLEKNGIKCLGYSYNGLRSTTTKTKPIHTPADLKGIKMRVVESPIFIDMYKMLGANATPMSFTELYTGLQQGTVEAQENTPSLIYANKFYEVQKFLSLDEHVNNFLPFIINKAKFDSLSDEQKKILTEEATAYVQKQRETELSDYEGAIKKLETEGGLKVNRLTEEQKQEFKTALKPLYEKYEKQFGKDLFDKCAKYNK